MASLVQSTHLHSVIIFSTLYNRCFGVRNASVINLQPVFKLILLHFCSASKAIVASSSCSGMIPDRLGVVSAIAERVVCPFVCISKVFHAIAAREDAGEVGERRLEDSK